jgi:predicted nucleic acid-binding Zn ribbon protein
VPDVLADARQLISSRLTDLDAEAKQLERALIGLGEGGAPRRRRPGRPAKRVGAAPKSASRNPKPPASRKPRSAKRAKRGQRQDELLAAIKAEPGARPIDLAKVIGIRSTQIHALIAKARAEKLIVVKKGGGYALKS